MNQTTNHHKKRLLFTLTLILATGFVSTGLISYFVAVGAMRRQIVVHSLPLTSDTIYSEIQRDLLLPAHVSSLMAHNTFLRDWLLNGEEDQDQIERYLSEIRAKYGAFSSFLVSETTKNYYYGEGLLKQVDPKAERDAWYFRLCDMATPYETNVDPDMANRDALTVFVNYKVLGYSGELLGATGVGLTIDSIQSTMEQYSQSYGRAIYYVDRSGSIVLRSAIVPSQAQHLSELVKSADITAAILASDKTSFVVKREGNRNHLNTRYIPELQWHLVVEQSERPLIRQVLNALITNLALCALITIAVLTVTYATVSRYQRQLDEMLEEERELRETTTAQRDEIARANGELQRALREVKQLSGLLPICSWCKKIRDDTGTWNRIETYIGRHTEVRFSHGLCPNCIREKHPEYAEKVIAEIEASEKNPCGCTCEE